MPSRAFLLDFLEKKEDNRERKEVNRMGRETRLCPYIARNVVGETFLERERGKRQGGGNAFLCLLI